MAHIIGLIILALLRPLFFPAKSKTKQTYTPYKPITLEMINKNRYNNINNNKPLDK